MNLRYIKVLTVLMALLFSIASHSALNLELTQGIRGAMPIAVQPFDGEQSLSVDQQLSKIIANDLQNSGRFQIVDANKTAENSVVGTVAAKSFGQYTVNFILKNNLGQQGKLLSQSFSVSSKSLRRLAHHISDLIFQQLTGTRGIFSTRVAYILVQQKDNYQKQYRLEVADADGYNPQDLVISSQPIMSPSWSPDGKKLAYVSFENQRSEIYVVDVSSGRRQLITQYNGINGAPSWSPNGRRLAIVLSKSGAPKIYLIDLQTKALQQLTQGNSIDTEPRWAPDGKSLIFTSDRGGSPQVYQYSFANRQIQRLTFSGIYNATASFTPNSQNIVFLHQEAGMFNIAKQSLENGYTQVLTFSGTDQSPTVAPNGDMVLYATKIQGRGVLSLVSIDGKIRLRLPAPEGDVQEPAWAPFT